MKKILKIILIGLLLVSSTLIACVVPYFVREGKKRGWKHRIIDTYRQSQQENAVQYNQYSK